MNTTYEYMEMPGALRCGSDAFTCVTISKLSHPANAVGRTVNSGIHKGKPFSFLPQSYLKQMVKTHAEQWEIAEAELSQRSNPRRKNEQANYSGGDT